MESILLKQGRILDPETNTDLIGDILIKDGMIEEISANIANEKAGRVLPMEGQWVMPGFVDAFFSSGEPGREDVETLAESARRAAKGGYTAIVTLPTTEPRIDNQALVKFILTEGRQSLVHVLPLGCLTHHSQGKQLAEMNELKKAGCVGFSDGRHPVTNTLIMRRALSYSKMVEAPIFSFPDDPLLSASGIANEGAVASELGLKASPAESEQISIARDILLTKLTEASINIGPITSKGSCDLIAGAKQDKVNIQSFTAAHYLYLTDQVYYHYLAEAKVFPPFRNDQDRVGLIEACKNGVIDFIVSDHNPHLPYEVEQELEYAPYGISTIETNAATAIEALYHQGKMAPLQIAALLSTNISKRLRLPFGRLTIGQEANITCLHPDKKHKITEQTFAGRCYNTPFIGQELRSFPSTVISKGRIVVENGELVDNLS